MNKDLPHTDPTAVSAPAAAPLSRRKLFVGAGAVGAVAAAAAVLPLAKVAPAPTLLATALPLAAEGGYQLTEHVKRYYQTARV